MKSGGEAMEEKRKIWTPEELLEALPGILEEGAVLPLVVSGGSMTPFLVGGRDTVYLSAVSRSLKRGDVVLYRRDNGKPVLHRICALEGDTFCLVGDAQQILESGIRRDQILAVVTAVRRKGKLLTPEDPLWKFLETVWLRVIPWRRAILACYGRIFGRKR